MNTSSVIGITCNSNSSLRKLFTPKSTPNAHILKYTHVLKYLGDS